MITYHVRRVVALAFLHCCIFFFGCAELDYPEADGGAPPGEAVYVAVEPQYICGATEPCVDYGSCCRYSGERCISICSTCSNRDTLEPSFQCYAVDTPSPPPPADADAGGLHVACGNDAECHIPHAIAFCDNGICQQRRCETGYAACSFSYGCPVHLAADPWNCGGCGVACAGGQTCVGGSCQ